MLDTTPAPLFEDEIRGALHVPMARDEFIRNLHTQIVQQADKKPRVTRPLLLRPVWVAVTILVVISISILAIGPQRVIAAIRSLFGYIPGVGIVDQSAPFRVLADPVSVTRDGISITVTSALLTGEKTHIEYRIFGVPGSAYPNREDVMGCTTPEYLRLPDGTRVKRSDNDFDPVPAGINAATLVMPCIFNTLPGKTPDNWELPLRFTPAPPDLTVIPVIDLSPSPQARLTAESKPPEPSGNLPTSAANDRITIIKEIETSDGYILVGQFPFQGLAGEQVHDGKADIRDASGKTVAFTAPRDIGPNAFGLDPNGPYWLMQFKAAGLAYPLTLHFSGAAIQPADPGATAQFAFDAGSNPQAGQEWTFNQELQLAGHTLKLTSIRADSRNGYSFSFQGDPKVIRADIQIAGHSPTGHGFGLGMKAGGFDVCLGFSRFPTGTLTVTLSNLTVAGETLNWQGQWSPAKPRTDLVANPTPQAGLCLTADSFKQLKPAPPELNNGKALVYEKIATGTWGLALYALDGSRMQVVAANGNWGALSPDGSKVAYSGTDSKIHLVDVASGADQVIRNASGFDIHWSPDGTQIAYIGMGNGAINSAFIARTDGSQSRQVSTLSYETILGWSPDGAHLYFAAPFTGGAAWKVYSYDIAGEVAKERFTIKNGTPKSLNGRISPDGKWIAYRGRDNSSLYLVRPDGGELHLLMDNVGATDLEWSPTGWLGVSIREPNSEEAMFVILKPDGCEAYLLPPSLNGNLEGWITP